METKICSRCNADKPLSEFRPHKLGKLGVHSICRECERAAARAYMEKKRREEPDKVKDEKRRYYQNHADKVREKNRNYYLAHREEALEKATAYRSKNRERINEWLRNYRTKHPEKITASDKASRERRSDKIKQAYKIYRQTHRAEIRQRNRARKKALKFSNQDYRQDDWKACLEYWGHKCAICGRGESAGVFIAADHWMPLSMGGKTHKANILPLCHGIGGCNNKKRDKHPFDWLLETFSEEEALAIVNRTEAYLSHV